MTSHPRDIRWLAALMAVAVVAGGGVVGQVPAAAQSAVPSGGSVVVIANGESVPDAAVAVSVAARNPLASVLLAEGSSSLGKSSEKALAARRPVRAVLIGGEAAIAPAVAQELRGIVPGIEVERIAGANRVKTALLALSRENSGPAPSSVAMVHGWSPHDIARGAALVVSGGADALLLTSIGKLSAPVASLVADSAPDRILLLGVVASDDSEAARQLEAVANDTLSVERFENLEPVEILALQTGGRIPQSIQHAVVANAASASDVLDAAMEATAQPGSVVLLAHGDRLGSVTAKVLENWTPSSITLVGAASELLGTLDAASPNTGTPETVVVVAYRESLTDAAVAVAVAASDPQYSVLLSESPSSLGASAASALAALIPDRAVLIGGEDAVSPAINRQLAEIVPGIEIERIVGGNRVQMSVLAFGHGDSGSVPSSVALVHGWSRQDIARGAALVASGGADALLYTSFGKLSAPVAELVADSPPERILLVGAVASDGSEAARQLEAVAGDTLSVERFEGLEPVEILASQTGGRIPQSIQHAVVANAASASDVLDAAVEATAQPGSVVLLAHGDRLGSVTAKVLENWTPSSIALVGAASELLGTLDAASPITDTPGVSTSEQVYTAVSAGGDYSCGLLKSRQIECWGIDGDGRISPPEGKYTAVSADFGHACALAAAGNVVCWGRNTYGRATPPSGAFKAVDGGWQHSCGIRSNKRLACWGRAKDNATRAPAGQFTAVSSGGGHNCALRTDGRVVCWGANGDGESNAPKGKFIAVETGASQSCAIRTDGRLLCWGVNVKGQTDAPDGTYVALSLGQNFGCALSRDGTVACWGNNEDGQSDPPDGEFASIEVGKRHSCGLRTDGKVTCWGFRSLPGVADVVLP